MIKNKIVYWDSCFFRFADDLNAQILFNEKLNTKETIYAIELDIMYQNPNSSVQIPKIKNSKPTDEKPTNTYLVACPITLAFKYFDINCLMTIRPFVIFAVI